MRNVTQILQSSVQVIVTASVEFVVDSPSSLQESRIDVLVVLVVFKGVTFEEFLFQKCSMHACIEILMSRSDNDSSQFMLFMGVIF